MSRVLKTGFNQITCSYAQHVANVAAGKAWAKGVDVVKNPSQCDYITAHTAGKVIKVVNYLNGTNKVQDKEGMGYGNYVMVLHDDNYVTLYAHLASVDGAIKEGVTVTKGQVIGFMGNTGNSYGAHLHFEVRKYASVPSGNLHDLSKYEWLDSQAYLDSDLPHKVCASPAATQTISNGKDGMIHVQSGSFSEIANAKRRFNELKAKGFPVQAKKAIVNGVLMHRIQLGAYSVRTNAQNMYDRVKSAGFDVCLTDEGGTDETL